MEHFESTTMAAPEVGVTANSSETVDGAAHRISGGNGGKLELEDFAFARYALKKSKVADRALVAVVDPSVEYQLNTLTNIVNVSNNPMWEGIVRDGIATGMRFVANVYGFDVYTSNYLKNDVADSALAERDGTTTNNFSLTTVLLTCSSQQMLPLTHSWVHGVRCLKLTTSTTKTTNVTSM